MLSIVPVCALAYEGGPVADSGIIRGQVTFRGTPPAVRQLPVTREPVVCGTSVPDESLVVGREGGIANAVVFLDGIRTGRPLPTATATLTSEHCVLRPHVQVLATGQVLEVKNADPIPHTIQAFLGGEEPVFHQPLAMQNQSFLQKMRKPGVLHADCNGTTWSSAFLFVRDHPYAVVTGADGRFELTSVPAGRYPLRVWHETLGEQHLEVTVAPPGVTDTAFVFPSH